MTIECRSYSRLGGERGDPQAEAREGEPASRNICELDSASLRNVGVAKLPELPKPPTAAEATFMCRRRAPRGGWRQRVGKARSRNLRDLVCPDGREKSDRLIVAENGLINRERRGLTVSVRPWKPPRPLGLLARYGLNEVVEMGDQAAMWSWQESRMREICTSGSKRGSSRVGVKTRLLLSTLPVH